MDIATIDRRRLIGWGALLPLAALAGCAAGPGGYSLDEGVRRLLTLSTQRAFGRLLQPGGFYEDQLARISPPDAIGAGGPGRLNAIFGAFLRSEAVRRRVSLALNDVAGRAAQRAAPYVLESIRGMFTADAVRTLRGGPQAATDLLHQRIGGHVVEVMVPELAGLLRSDLLSALSAAAAEQTGIDYLELGRTVAEQAADGIFRVIGREEAAIRADPAATRDPVLIALLRR
ncbi:DUF4197 family protein [Sphingomonas profundi]|uniref:DUF4197 family protein n=1 Tax=Alterirhizorhabdus profundi TaxID=2681549 RepID=UPI0018D15AF4|nr:DUF4197 family protein [Sphingomonas profundi]